MTAELAEDMPGQAAAGQATGQVLATPVQIRPTGTRRLLATLLRYLLHPPVPLRWRLALLYAAVLGFTLAVADLTAYISLARYLSGELDENLRSQAREISGTIDLRREASQTQSRVNVFIRFPNLDAFAAPGMTVQVLNLDGKVILQSENLRDRALPVDAEHVELALRGTSSFDTVSVDQTPVRFFYTPLEPSQLEGNVAGAIQITRSLRDLEVTLARLRLVFFGIGASSLFVATVVGYLLARAALSPIGRLTRDARSIGESRDFNRRVAVPRTLRASRDEVTRLAVTFNQMLGQLHAAYDEQEHTLASQRRFVADASHELRTPLATIRTNLELLQRAGDDLAAADRDEAMADALAEIERLSRLVSDLLTLARVDSGLRLERHEPIRVDKVVREVYRQARLMAMSREHRVVADPIEPATVLGDADYLKELLLVLVDNAIQYTPDGGEICLSLRREGDEAIIAVSDNGVGIGSEDLPHLFERFYRADHARHRMIETARGTGLGLSIAKWIAEEHDGRIAVESEYGQGTTFTLFLPAVAPPTDDEAPAPTETPALARP